MLLVWPAYCPCRCKKNEYTRTHCNLRAEEKEKGWKILFICAKESDREEYKGERKSKSESVRKGEVANLLLLRPVESG